MNERLGSNLVSSKILDGNGISPMPGTISVSSFDSVEEEEHKI